MKFRIKRTSDFFAVENKPSKNAYGGKPLKEDSDKHIWYIDINTVEDLIQLRDEVEEPLIINTAWEDELNGMPEIEIYDDYRE